MPSSRRSRELAGVALDNAPIVLQIAKAAADFAPVPVLGLVVECLSAIIERVQDARTNSKTAAAFFEKIAELDAAITEIVRRAGPAVDGPGRVALFGRLEKLLSTIIKLQRSAGDLKGGHGLTGRCKKFLYAKHNEGILEDMNMKLTDAIALFQLRSQVEAELALNDVGQDVKVVRHAILSADEDRLIQSIPHANAGYHSVDELKSGFLQGTRQELFEEFQTWCLSELPSDGPKPFYLLDGGAGLGKSSATHQLCTRISEQWGLNLGASFFFSRGRGDLESAQMIFPTMAYQLALSQPMLRPFICAAVSEYRKDGERQQMQNSFERLLWSPLTGSLACRVDQPITFIIVDGLDECKDRHLIPQLLRNLLNLARIFPWLRIFVAARPEPHILPYLACPDAEDVVYHRSLNDTVDDWKDDVGLYLRSTVPQLDSCRAYVRANPKVLERLISRADGVFIFARVAVNFLEKIYSRPNEMFDLVLGSRDSKLPPLDNLYLQVLRLAFPTEDLDILPQERERLRSLLTFLALRKEDLPPGAIALLLGLPEDDVINMTDRLRSVLVIDRAGNVVPLHATFGEFIVDAERCIDPVYHINPAKGHALLAAACLAIYTFELASQYLVSMRDKSNAAFEAYIAYTRNWGSHVPDAEGVEDLQQKLRMTIRDQLLIQSRVHRYADGHADEYIRDLLQVGSRYISYVACLTLLSYPSPLRTQARQQLSSQNAARTASSGGGHD
ncbi:hypothetical protein PsYK624_084810 [Phanerochaete sordida]|uniref:Nephrocystin 3-like N-terminal domain-containing protein n=1 Tax=Phanerochaete sordida TaxID=48140 RepID=A0A9P3GCW2_9APHY|nr:hypothetical protein PsYK624_084810 [Phanerochaete sordida]